MKKTAILFLIFFISCSPQKRLQRLIKNHPDLIKPTEISFIDSTISPKHFLNATLDLKRLDFKYLNPKFITGKDTGHKSYKKGDTIYYKQDKISLKLVLTDSTIFANATTDPDTIVKKITKKVDTLYVKKCFWSSLNRRGEFFVIFAILLIAFILFISIKKIQKNGKDNY